MSPEQYWIARALYQEGLSKAAQERRRPEADRAASLSRSDRLRIALSDRLIAWGQRVRPHVQPDAAQP